MIKKYKITLVAFYSKNLKNSYIRFYKHAKDLNIFDNIYILGENELEKDTQFISEHEYLIDNYKSGFGLALWKPYIIESAFNKFNESEYFFYLDIGSEFNINKNTINRFYEYFDHANKNNIFAFRNRDLEENLTHCSVINNIYKNARGSRQFNSGTLIFKNNNFSLDIVKEWKSESIKNNYYNLLNDKNVICCKSWNGNHLWDQSVLSCILKKYKIEGISDEADWYITGYSTSNLISENRKRYPIFSARNPFLKSILHKNCISYSPHKNNKEIFTTCIHGNNCKFLIKVR